MSTENTSENNSDPKSLLDLIDPNRIAAVRAPGLDFQLHSDRDSIAREKWEEQKKAAAAGIRTTTLLPPGPR